MSRYKSVTIEWSYPIRLDKILQKECMNDIGLYYISRVFGNKESILYIGKTTHSFGQRLQSHCGDWIDTYRGEKFVRLGRIVKPSNLSQEKLKQLINDSEKTIIFYMHNEDEHDLIANVVSTQSTYPSEDLLIINTGYRGQLPRELFIPEDYNI